MITFEAVIEKSVKEEQEAAKHLKEALEHLGQSMLGSSCDASAKVKEALSLIEQ